MTRRDYIRIAAALREAQPETARNAAGREIGGPSVQWIAWSRCADALADVLALDNPRFDRERFMLAAGGAA